MDYTCDEYKINRWISDSEKRREIYEKLGSLPYHEHIDEFCKRCYEYGESVEFNAKKIKEYANDMDWSYDYVRKSMRRYAFLTLGMNLDEWRRTTSGKNREKNFMKRITTSSKYKALYEMVGGVDCFEFKDRLDKVCFEYIERHNYDYHMVLLFCNEWDLDTRAFINCVRNHAKNSGISLKFIDVKIENMYRLRYEELAALDEYRVDNVIKKLINSSNFDDIYTVLSDVKNLEAVYKNISRYVKSNYSKYSEREQNKLVEDTKKKIKSFVRQRNKYGTYIDRKTKRVRLARAIVKAYLDSDLSSQKEFCLVNGISIKDFVSKVAIVRQNDEELYRQYEKRLERYQNKVYAILVSKVNEIIFKMKNGIDGREFGIEDYYEIFSIDVETLIKLSKGFLDNEDLKLLVEFSLQNKNNGKKRVLTNK